MIAFKFFVIFTLSGVFCAVTPFFRHSVTYYYASPATAPLETHNMPTRFSIRSLFFVIPCALIFYAALGSTIAHAAISGVKSIEIKSSANSGSQFIQIAEVVAHRETNGSDAALASQGTTATAVSVYANRTARYGTENSIDGDLRPGHDSLQNYYHSAAGANEHLTVTFAGTETLSGISIIGREDCCSSRDLYDITLRDAAGRILATYASASANNSNHTASLQFDGGISVAPAVKRIVVRSSASSVSNYIQVAEVIAQRLGDNVDVATTSNGATATAVSTYANKTARFNPNKAIDANAAPGRDSLQNYYHSAGAANEALTITLAQATPLASLTLVGRADCCSNRDVYDVDLFDDNNALVASYRALSAYNSAHTVSQQSFETSDANAATEGHWGPVLDWPLVAVSMANLPDGRILTYSGSERRTWPSTERTYSAIWNPQSGVFEERIRNGHNMFCGAAAMTADGNVFVNGGRNGGNSRWTSLFNHANTSWSAEPNMASGGRWYPTTLALGSGEIMTAMGNSSNVRNPEVWNQNTGWRLLNGIDFINLRQNHNEIRRESVFPLLSQAPDGRVYHFWDTSENHLLDLTGNGVASVANANTDRNDHAGGIQVMYDTGKLLIAGQNDGSWGGNSSIITANAFTVDLNTAAPRIRATGSMTSKRKFHQMIPLPTGEVLVVGGNTTGTKFADNGSVLHAEIWNPQTGQFRSAASMSIPRDYHSSALLMPDGRILTAGGGYHPNNPSSPGTHQDAQIYSPPYLFDASGQPASRPTVSASTSLIGHGQQFQVQTTGNIAYFSLIRMSATTHAINTDVRQFRPQFSAAGNNQYTITMHGNPNIAVPGYWMLFAVDNNGVPSVSETIKVAGATSGPGNGNGPAVVPIVSSALQAGSNNSFSVSAAGNGLSYSWNFGDGTGDTPYQLGNSINHNFASAGRYTVSVTVLDASGNSTVETFTQMVHRPLTAGKPVASSGIAEVTARGELYVVNPDNNTVSVVRASNPARLAEIAVGDEPRSVAVAPDGRVWVVNKGAATVSVINPGNRSIVQTITLDPGSMPHGIVMGNGRAYIALQGLATVVQLNASNGQELRRAFAGETPRHLSLNGAANRLYVSSFITPPVPGEHTGSPNVAAGGGEVRAFSTSANALALQRVISLAHSNREISEHSGPGIPNYLGPAVVSPDGTSAFVASKQDNVLGGGMRSGTDLEFDQTVRAVTSMIALPSESEILANRVDHDNSSVGSHGAFGPNGLVYFTTLEGNRQVAMIDVFTSLELTRFDTGRAPQSSLVSADGTRLYVHNFMDRTLSTYDIGNVVESGSLAANELTRVTLVANEQLASSVLKGKQLFYDARDDRLAALDYMSCASCHNEGGQDGRTWDFSGQGEGLRNTISLNGRSGMGHGLLHWSANFDEVQDFEGQIREFAGGTGLMSDSLFFGGTRSNPLGNPKAGLSADLDSLAAYVQSLNEVVDSPYRDSDGTLDAVAEAGKTLFTAKGCASCHSGNQATDSASTPNLHNIGTLDTESGSRLSGALSGLDTPTLLGAWNTAPYLHDGSAGNIEAAINAHSTISVSNQETAQLAAFVRQISASDLGAAGTNLVFNGSFEQGQVGSGQAPTGWTIQGAGGRHVSASRASQGPAYYAMDGWSKAQNGIISQVISTQPRKTYRLSFGVGKWSGNGVVPMLNVETANGANTIMSSVVNVGSKTNHEFFFEATHTSTTLRFSDATPTTQVDYDIDLDNVVVVEFTPFNIVQNGSFEQGPVGPGQAPTSWTITGTGGRHRSGSRATDGVGYYPMDGWGSAQDGTISQVIPTQPGKNYKITFGVGKYAGSGVVPRLKVETGNGSSISMSRVVAVTGKIGYTLFFEASHSSTTLRFSDVTPTTNVDYDIDLDKVVVVEFTPFNLVQNGSFEQGLVGSGVAPTDWTISGSGGRHQSSSRASNGVGYYAMDGWGRAQNGVISQSISTVPGRVYTVSFDVSKWSGATSSVNLRVEALNNATTNLSGTVGVGSPARYAYSFIASANSTLIRFSDASPATPGDYDINLDNVRVAY